MVEKQTQTVTKPLGDVSNAQREIGLVALHKDGSVDFWPHRRLSKEAKNCLMRIANDLKLSHSATRDFDDSYIAEAFGIDTNLKAKALEQVKMSLDSRRIDSSGMSLGDCGWFRAIEEALDSLKSVDAIDWSSNSASWKFDSMEDWCCRYTITLGPLGRELAQRIGTASIIQAVEQAGISLRTNV